MARNYSGQMALYEAVDQDRFKAAQEKEIERIMQPPRIGDDQPVAAPAPPPRTVQPPVARQAPASAAISMRKPAVQANKGRIELFVPVSVIGILGLVLVILLLLAFKFGQWSAERAQAQKVDAQKASDELVAQAAQVAKKMAVISTAPVVKPVVQNVSLPAEVPVSKGNIAIVLKQLANPRNLEPAKKYFDEHGVATEIVQSGSSYLLISKARFESVTRGEGLAALQKIKQVGLQYKAPAGYGSFAPKMFNDAYGKKI
jgi:hypothetical protein